MRKLFLMLFLTSAIATFAQYERLPIDSAVRMGRLPNGLTYYIRHNDLPKNRCEFHIAQNVGSILEREDQLGLAHFLEHMAFNGSEHFPGRGILNYFESIGVSFGGNINAYTSIDETVYRLSDIPTYRQGIIDSALLTLYDWSNALTLADNEIDKERGVILAEWRTTNSPARRMYTSTARQLYAGTQYENRMPIGDTAIIKNFSYQALRDYYHKWYGPDLQAIIVVGDIDVDKIEIQIKELFGKIPARKNIGERPWYGLNDNVEPLVAFSKDKEATNSIIQVKYKHKTPLADFKLSAMGYTKNIIDQLISAIFSYRFEEITISPESNILSAGVGYGAVTKKDDAAYAYAAAKDGKEREAFKDLLIELQKAYQHGFTNAELQRAKTDLLNSYEKSYNERNNVQNISIAQECIRNFTDSEPIPGIEWEYNFLKKVLPVITKEQLYETLRSYIIEQNIMISFQGADKEEVIFPTKEEVLSTLKEVKGIKFDAPKEEVIAKNLVDKKPKAGKIVARKYLNTMGATEWTLSNGVKVVIKPTEFKSDEILLRASSWGGLNAIGIDNLPSANFATLAVECGGVGEFSAIDLQKVLSGKNVSVSTTIDDVEEGFSGQSSVKDFETMLQLIYLRFKAPRIDENAFKSLMQQYYNYVNNRNKNPKVIFSDTLSAKWSCYDKRNIPLNKEFLDKVDYDKALAIFSQRFVSPSDFVFIFTGNIDPKSKDTEKQICTWLGSIKKGKKETYIKQANCHPKGKNSSSFKVSMEIDNPKNTIRYHSPMDYTMDNRLNMTVLGYILDYRYTETIREDEGGSYGVGVYGTLSKLPESEAKLIVQFDCHPEKQKRLVEIVHQEIKKLAEQGPSIGDLSKAKENLVKDYNENIEQNNYWSSIIDVYYMYGMDYASDYRKAIDNVTKQTIQATLQHLLNAGNVFELFMFSDK